jgi:hypothetical protein
MAAVVRLVVDGVQLAAPSLEVKTPIRSPPA